MIHFVVVSGERGQVRRVKRGLDGALDATRVVAGRRVNHEGAGGTWAAAADVVADPLLERRIAVDHDAIVLVNGPAVAVRSEQEDLASSALRSFRLGGSTALADSLRGCFNVVAIDPGHGLRAFGDFSGLFPLYWSTDRDLVVVSNRSTTVREVIGARGWRPRPLAWVISSANLVGTEVPAAGVSSVPAGDQLRADTGTGAACIERGPTWVWPTAGNDPRPGDLSSAEWDEVTHELVEGVRKLHAVPGRMRVQLTGGKDSRLSLAITRAALGPDAIEAVTNGTVDSPEVHYAALVADVAGVSHERIGPPAPVAGVAGAPSPPEPPFEAEAHWTRLRQHLHRHECIVSPWDGVTLPLRGMSIFLRGFGGELYRRSSSKRFRSAHRGTLEEMADLFVDFHQPHDPLRVLTRSERRFQEREVRRWVTESAGETRVDLLPERFYVQEHIGHWNGPLTQNTPTRIALSPLLSSAAARINLRMSAEDRSAERLHFEVLRRTAPELLDVPFLDDAWSPVLDPPVPRPSPVLPTPSTQMPTAAGARRSWQWQFLDHERDRIADLFRRAERSTELPEVCDVSKVRAKAAKLEGLRVSEAKQILTCVSCSLALLGEEERFVDQPG